jgi:AcrR family transcriptional regulator
MDRGHATATKSATVPTTTKRRPLRRDAERNRLLILSAAHTVFAQRGLEASLDEVAREAGLGVGTVYRRFPNRDALIDALFAEGVDTITRLIDEALATPRAWDGMRRFMTVMMELQCQDKGLRDAILSSRGPHPMDDVLRHRITQTLYELVRRAQQDGDLRPDVSPTDVAILSLAALNAAEFTSDVEPEASNRYLTLILDSMRARPDGDGGNSRLEQPALDDEQLDECMIGWKYGSRETPRQRQRPTT